MIHEAYTTLQLVLAGLAAVAIVLLATIVTLYLLRHGVGGLRSLVSTKSTRAASTATSRRAVMLYASGVSLVGAIAILALMWRYLGPLNTILYAFLFVAALGALPAYIGLLGAAAPGSKSISMLHTICGAMAFWRTVLVQTDDRWLLCPARRNPDDDAKAAYQFYLDGAWVDIDGGYNNWSMLGWRPFGILRHKTDDTMRDQRVDTAAQRGRRASADGGAIERGGVTQESMPAVSGIDGEWLIDLKQVFTRGVQKMGDIELIEIAEEITSRNHAASGITSGRETLIGTIVGLVLGIGTAWAMYGGV